MTSGRSGRKKSNVYLTRKYHFRYNGLWIIVSVALVILLNMMLFLLMEERWAGLYSLNSAFHAEYVNARRTVLGALGMETVLFVIGIVWLAKFTAHRVAGPYIRLMRVFEAVRDGNMGQDLRFRSYDHLEEVEKAFNEMMSSIRKQVDRTADEKQ